MHVNGTGKLSGALWFGSEVIGEFHWPQRRRFSIRREPGPFGLIECAVGFLMASADCPS